MKPYEPYETLKAYLTGDVRHVLYVLPDGVSGICDCGDVPKESAWTGCIGLKFCSASLYHYLERNTGKRLEDFDTVIRECVRDGNVEELFDDIIDAIGLYWGVGTRRGYDCLR